MPKRFREMYEHSALVRTDKLKALSALAESQAAQGERLWGRAVHSQEARTREIALQEALRQLHQHIEGLLGD